MSYRTVQCKDPACVGGACDKWHESRERRIPRLCRYGDACKMARNDDSTGRLAFCSYQHFFNTPRLCQPVSPTAALPTPPTVARPEDAGGKDASVESTAKEEDILRKETPSAASHIAPESLSMLISGARDKSTVSLTASTPERVSTLTSGATDECVVCLAAPNTHAMVSCGHQCVCGDCAREIMRNRGFCPMCNQEIMMVMEVFK